MAASRAVVIGAGPAGLMAAEVLARAGASVAIFDRMPSPGRKLLLAGRGGLNLTHSEPEERFATRYGEASAPLRTALAAFSPAAARAWAHGLGEPTFIGSSGRVFPVSFKASPLLRAWLRRLDGLGVTFRPRHRWEGWDPGGRLRFSAPAGPVVVEADVSVLALGGASWPHLGSDGSWTAILAAEGIEIAPLRPSNCGFRVGWTDLFRDRFEGSPVKGVAVTFGSRTVRGELTVTRAGLEGGALYALAAPLRDAIEAERGARIEIALRPDLDSAEIERRLAARPNRQSLSTVLSKALNLAPVAIGLLREASIVEAAPLAGLTPAHLALRINAVPIRLTGPMPIDRAISTAGGIRFDQLDAAFMLRHRPGTFAAGEMLDWEAPTGGYLLQAVWATGVAAGEGALRWLAGVGGEPRQRCSLGPLAIRPSHPDQHGQHDELEV